jgi:Arc/MetJ-type ribon-helix-helix transcriptional regulator
MKRSIKSARLTIAIPVAMMQAVDKYVNERRFESHEDLVIEALHQWLEAEHDEELWEQAQKHEEGYDG